jgi:4a-hydroxytetrahydrobiopterin dehydratase
MTSLLDDAAVAAALAARPGWTRDGAAIVRVFERPSFADAIAFVVRIGFLAEAASHHPDLDLRWRTVRVELSTHSAGGITDQDFDLARAIDEVA